MKAIVFGALLLCGCPPAVTPPTPNPYASDAAPTPIPLDGAVPTFDCSGACQVLRSYGCPEGFGVAGGDSCQAVCQRAQGPYDMQPVCIVKNAGSLAAIKSCGSLGGTVIKCVGVSP
jgi:hypothetical protein